MLGTPSAVRRSLQHPLCQLLEAHAEQSSSSTIKPSAITNTIIYIFIRTQETNPGRTKEVRRKGIDHSPQNNSSTSSVRPRATSPPDPRPASRRRTTANR